MKIKSVFVKSFLLLTLLCLINVSAWANDASDLYYYAKVETQMSPEDATGYGTVYNAVPNDHQFSGYVARSSSYYKNGNWWEGVIQFQYTLSVQPNSSKGGYFLYWQYKTGDADFTKLTKNSSDYSVVDGRISCTTSVQPSSDVQSQNAKVYTYEAVMAQLYCATPATFDPINNSLRSLSVAHANAGTVTATITNANEEDKAFYFNTSTPSYSTDFSSPTTLDVVYKPTTSGQHTATLTLTSNVKDYSGNYLSQTINLQGDDCEPIFTWTPPFSLRSTEVKTQAQLVTVNSGQPITLSVESGTCGSVTNNVFTAGESGDTDQKITLKAYVPAANGYKAASSTQEYTITSKTIQSIVWNQDFQLLYAGDDAITLNAYAVVNGIREENTQISYSLSDVSPAGVVTLNNGILSINNSDMEGSAILKATTVTRAGYQTVSMEKIVEVHRHASCEINLATDHITGTSITDGYKIANNNGTLTTLTITNTTLPAQRLSFKVAGSKNQYGGLAIIAYNSPDCTGDSYEIGPADPSCYSESAFSGKEFICEAKMQDSFRSYKISFNNTDPDDKEKNNNSVTISDINLLQANYITSETASKTVTAYVNTPTEITLNISYAGVPAIIVSNTQTDYVEIESPSLSETSNKHSIPGVKCEAAGEYTITLSVNSPIEQTINETITLTDEINGGITKEIPITINVIKGETFYFVIEDGAWNEANNWLVGDNRVSTPIPPTAANPVVLEKTCKLNSNAVAYGLTISNAENKVGGLEIQPTGGLSVYQGGLTGATSTNLKIASNATGMGYLRVHPSATNKTVSASVDLFVHGYTDYHSIADAETEEDKLKAINAAIWQYLGTPMATTPQSIDYYGWMYERSNNAWKVCNTSTNLTPFAGYAMTQSLSEDGAAFTCSGQLYGFKDWTGTPAEGFQLLANSFTAPIDITKFERIPNDVIYLYREGSFDNYTKDGAETVEPDPNNLSGITSFADFISAGQYLAIPLGTAKLLPKGFATIPPSQGFCIYADGNSLTLDYDELVWGGEGFGLHTRAMAPARKRATEASEEIVLSEVLGLRVVGDRGSDALGLIESTAFSASFDSGFDGSKVFGSSANPQLYTTEPSGNMMVSATNDLEGMYIGFDAAETDKETLSNYTIEVLYAQEGEYILHDNVTNKDMTLAVGNAYQFTETPGTINEMRFQIQAKGTDGPTTSLVNYGKDETIRMWENNGKLFVSSSIAAEQILRIYDMQGKIVANTKFTGTLTYDLSTLPQGAYMANVGNKSIKIVLK